MMRRSFLTLLFAVLLMFAQQAAVQHTYAHVADSQQSSSDDDKRLPKHSEACGKCVALADIEHAVAAKSQVVYVASAQFQQMAALTQSFAAAINLSYLSRAPPSLT